MQKSNGVLWDDPDRDALKDIEAYSNKTRNSKEILLNEGLKLYPEFFPKRVREFLKIKNERIL